MREDSRRQFGREAEKYVTSAVHADPDALSELVAHLGPSGGRVVDVGTGAGHLAMALAPHVDHVVALDPTPEMLEVTQRQAVQRGVGNLTTLLGFAESLPFGDGELDGVACRVAAHHFHDVRAFVSESARVLKPGGWFLLVDTVSPEDDEADRRLNIFETIRDPSHVRDYRPSEWVSFVEGAGLTVQGTTLRWKSLDFEEWMSRMSVSPGDRVVLRAMWETADGAFRQYLEPVDGQFRLEELTLTAQKPL